MLFQVWYIIAFETQFEKYRKYRNITKSEQEIFLKKKTKENPIIPNSWKYLNLI